MRRVVVGSWLTLAALCACSGTSSTGFAPDGGGGGGGSGSGSSGGGGPQGQGDDGGTPGSLGGGSGSGSGSGGGPQGDASVVVTTTIYANTDDSLYSMDPKTKAVTPVGNGKFTGMGGGTGDTSITDVAVNGAGDVYVNSESVVYKATLPAGSGSVALTKVAQIQTTGKFYALGFTPPGALGAGTGEVLVGGDINGELWSIDTGSGATKDLGNFGTDPDDAARFLSLSGDVVFYLDAAGAPKGLATIRSCAPGASSGKAPTCTRTDDVLAAIDMAALGVAFTSGTPAKSLNGGMYGGSATTKGPGIGHGEVFGLGAWEGSVFGFSRNMTSPATPPALYSIDTASGAGSAIAGSPVGFTNGWSGAGVTSKVTVTVQPPPPPPPPPK
jgi:hypothetical protein